MSVKPIAPEIALALGIAANPGAYALLLGSGVSRSAGIPTGWEVVVDLIRRIAAARGDSPEPEPAAWYRTTFDREPTYATLLESIAATPAERQALLKSYFESTGVDDEKRPTAAHHAIAVLAARGFIRVIITTNFDRLLESALESAGVSAAVLSTADQIEGAVALAHSRCTVIKVHGDYLDTRIRNSPQELQAYDSRVDRLLDQIFDEYGLVTCGWSSDYDDALRGALERSRSRRYSSYWCSRGQLSDAAQRLITHRGFTVIPIRDADAFFQRLKEQVFSAVSLARQPPVETQLAVEELKRHIPRDESRIELAELIRDSTGALLAEVNDTTFPTNGDTNATALGNLVARYGGLAERLVALLSNGAFWGGPSQHHLWLSAVRRLAEAPQPRAGLVYLLKLRRYPALLSMYAVGVATVAAENYELLASLLRMPVRAAGANAEPLVTALYLHDVIDPDAAHLIRPNTTPGGGRFKTPASDHLFDTLRRPFAELVPSDLDYVDAFDRFEYYASLVHADLHHQEFGTWGFAGGSYEWRDGGNGWLPTVTAKEIDTLGTDWPPLQAGLFNGSIARLREVKAEVDAEARRVV